MASPAALARSAALHCEAKKHAYRQTQDGVVVSFVLHPQEVPEGLATAALGTRYVLALVAINDDETPKEAGSSSGRTSDFDSENARSNRAPAAKKNWHDMSPAQQAGVLCNEQPFWKYMDECGYEIANADEAAEAVRDYCKVASRKDIVPGTLAASAWSGLVSQYRAWMLAPGVGA